MVGRNKRPYFVNVKFYSSICQPDAHKFSCNTTNVQRKTNQQLMDMLQIKWCFLLLGTLQLNTCSCHILKDQYDKVLSFSQSVRKPLLHSEHTLLTAYLVCTRVTPSSRTRMAKKQRVKNVEGTRPVVLETKRKDTPTIISKVHGIPPLKAAVDDKFCLTAS